MQKLRTDTSTEIHLVYYINLGQEHDREPLQETAEQQKGTEC